MLAMRRSKSSRFVLILTILAFVLVAAAADNPKEIHGGNGITLPPPPPTDSKTVTDAVAGKQLTDPYRWLEDGHSPETRAWITSQMRYTEDYLAKIKVRPQIVKRLTELERVESYSLPEERQGNYFFTKRLPEENQASIYLRKGLRGADERLIDATKLSADQNTSIDVDDISEDGSLLAYSIRQGGADEQTEHFLDLRTHQDLPDTLPLGRYFGMSLAPDKLGVYYSKVDNAGSLVFYHRMGTPLSSDQLLFGKKFNDETFGPMQLISAQVTENGHYLLIGVSHGVPSTRDDYYIKDLRTPDSAIRPIVHGIESRFYAVNYADDLYLSTDYQAPNYRVVKVSLNDPAPEHWVTVVPESKDVI